MVRRAEPPDGGWGWMVVLSAFFQSALVFGVLRSFGVFFVEFVAAFEEQAARVSWIASIGIAVQQFGSPIGSALSTKLGPRPVVMTGGILAALGMLLASFATSLTHLYLSIGLLSVADQQLCLERGPLASVCPLTTPDGLWCSPPPTLPD